MISGPAILVFTTIVSLLIVGGALIVDALSPPKESQ